MLRASTSVGYVGIFFGVAIVIGWMGGRWLDGRFGTDPWLQTVGILVGVAAGFRELYRVSRRYQKEQRQADAAARRNEKDEKSKDG